MVDEELFPLFPPLFVPRRRSTKAPSVRYKTIKQRGYCSLLQKTPQSILPKRKSNNKLNTPSPIQCRLWQTTPSLFGKKEINNIRPNSKVITNFTTPLPLQMLPKSTITMVITYEYQNKKILSLPNKGGDSYPTELD